MTFFCHSRRGEGEKGSPHQRLWDRLQGQDKQGVQGAYYCAGETLPRVDRRSSCSRNAIYA